MKEDPYENDLSRISKASTVKSGGANHRKNAVEKDPRNQTHKQRVNSGRESAEGKGLSLRCAWKSQPVLSKKVGKRSKLEQFLRTARLRGPKKTLKC